MYIAAGLFALAIILGGGVGFQLLQTQSQASAEESPTNVPLPSITGVVDAPIFAPVPPDLTLEPIPVDHINAQAQTDDADTAKYAHDNARPVDSQCQIMNLDMTQQGDMPLTLNQDAELTMLPVGGRMHAVAWLLVDGPGIAQLVAKNEGVIFAREKGRDEVQTFGLVEMHMTDYPAHRFPAGQYTLRYMEMIIPDAPAIPQDVQTPAVQIYYLM
jgi:hypothetical protein